MTGWLEWEVPSEAAAFCLLIMAVVTGTFGVWSVLHVRDATGSWRSPGRRSPDLAFEWWLGGFLLTDAAIYGVLGGLTALGDGGTALWGLALVIASAVFAAGAMRWFGHARVEERR